MQQHIKYLAIEDNKPWSEAISNQVRKYFEQRRGLYPSRIRCFSAYDGDQGNQQLSEGRFDLVTLDLNLGKGVGHSKINGLDLLGEIAAGNRAYFVIIITGAVNDQSLEQLYGKDAAALMRYGALNEAVRSLAAERVRILHKPVNKEANAAMQELAPHLWSALDQYCQVSFERNIFRPLPGHNKLWEVRYNGGPRLTVPGIKAFEMIRSALNQPNREMKVIDLIQQIARSSGKDGAVTVPDIPCPVPRLDANDKQGVGWEDLDGLDISEHVPVDTDDGAIDLEALIGALLLAKRQGIAISETVKAFVKNFGVGPLLLLPGRIKQYSGNRTKAEKQFAMDQADVALVELNTVLIPLLQPYREQRGKIENAGSSKHIRVASGHDTPELRLARQHWKRARTALRKYPAIKNFLIHIEKCVERGLTAKGHIHYVPADGSEFTPFWLTE